MGLSILKYIWFIFVLASGLVAVLLGSLQYGVKIDFASWARVSNEILNEIPVFLNSPMVVSYGFYGGLLIFLVFLLLFVITSRAARKSKSEPDYSLDTDSDVSAQAPMLKSDDSQPDLSQSSDTLQAETFDQLTETPSLEADNRSSRDDATGESTENERDEYEYQSNEDEFERNDELSETLQSVKDRDER